jgi:hypothetical protein
VIVGEVKIDATRILGEADMDGALRSVKLRAPRANRVPRKALARSGRLP